MTITGEDVVTVSPDTMKAFISTDNLTTANPGMTTADKDTTIPGEGETTNSEATISGTTCSCGVKDLNKTIPSTITIQVPPIYSPRAPSGMEETNTLNINGRETSPTSVGTILSVALDTTQLTGHVFITTLKLMMISIMNSVTIP